MPDGYYLSESDLRRLEDALDRLDQMEGGGRSRGQRDSGIDDQEMMTPEVYVALTPGGGVAAMSGTTPGSATCQVYRVTAAGALESVTGVTRVVKNLSTTAVPAALYCLIQRDKFGTWFCTGGGLHHVTVACVAGVITTVEYF